MDRFVQSIRRQLDRARDVEGFVVRIVAGGLALVVGLWLLALATLWSPPWLLGATLAVIGVVALGSGIWSEIEY
jgi:fatty acid desaturase